MQIITLIFLYRYFFSEDIIARSSIFANIFLSRRLRTKFCYGKGKIKSELVSSYRKTFELTIIQNNHKKRQLETNVKCQTFYDPYKDLK